MQTFYQEHGGGFHIVEPKKIWSLYTSDLYRMDAYYATIGKAVGMSNNTVRKYVQELEERGLIVTERTSIITQDGRKQNGSLLYTILPIQFSIDQFYQRQMDAVDRAKERQRVARRMEPISV